MQTDITLSAQKSDQISTTATTPSPSTEKPKNGAAPKESSLQSKNVRIHNRRTSVRLEPEMWNALNEIATIEGCTVHDLCSAVHDMKEQGSSFTAALRVFLMEYYRTATKTDQKISQVQKRLGVNAKKPAEQRIATATTPPLPQKIIA